MLHIWKVSRLVLHFFPFLKKKVWIGMLLSCCTSQKVFRNNWTWLRAQQMENYLRGFRAQPRTVTVIQPCSQYSCDCNLNMFSIVSGSLSSLCFTYPPLALCVGCTDSLVLCLVDENWLKSSKTKDSRTIILGRNKQRLFKKTSRSWWKDVCFSVVVP